MNGNFSNEVIDNALRENSETIETALEEYLSEEYTGDTVVAEAMRYSALGGGKRIRAFLVREFCKLFGGKDEAAIPFACAIECIHAYSLIHDDLPCMDDDDLRRGKPSCHIQFGEAEALLAGDGLLTLAFEICASNRNVSHKSLRFAVAELAQEAGALGMIGGQALDMKNSFETYDELKDMYGKKTGALIRASALLGYFAAVESPTKEDIEALTLYSEALGLAFQIKDDILDVVSDTATLGKTVGTDAKNNKKTSVAYMTLNEAENEVGLLTLLAVEAISGYENSEILSKLAVRLMSRNK